MYLIRGQHNLELFNKKFPNEKLCGTIGNFDGLFTLKMIQVKNLHKISFMHGIK